jgi:hypothetical protein
VSERTRPPIWPEIPLSREQREQNLAELSPPPRNPAPTEAETPRKTPKEVLEQALCLSMKLCNSAMPHALIHRLEQEGYRIAPAEVAASDGVTVSENDAREICRYLWMSHEPGSGRLLGVIDAALQASAPATTARDEREGE